MTSILTSRPRNVNSWRAAAILYGDWGTSKAYVLGIAFALAGYSSFWYILAISILTLLVGLNYILICKYYPNGGGVYASVRNRSKVLSIIGAFFLVSDYLVTAALSAVSAFHYIGVAYPEFWAIGAIATIGALNFLGPKHTGSMAMAFAVPMLIVVFCLALVSIPFLPAAVHGLQPLHDSFAANWSVFVGIVVALSGIEAIANTTGSMQLDPKSTLDNPSVVKTSTPAITMVMLEVCIFTALLGLAMNALPGLEIHGEDVNAPGYPNVRDAMLRYMGEVFGGAFFGPTVGYVFSIIISIVVMLLLLSAVNTAMVALISLLFVMSKDGELPDTFQKLNRFGVPLYAAIATLSVPMLLILFVHDVVGLANLYAIGFVGAIAVNLGATATNFKLDITTWRRCFMFGTFLIMAAIEVTLFIEKPHARFFVMSVMACGLLLRALVAEQREREIARLKATIPELPPLPSHTTGGHLVVVSGLDKCLDYAMKESDFEHEPLHVLFLREQRVLTTDTDEALWVQDDNACAVVDHIIANLGGRKLEFLYTVTAHPVHSIAEIAAKKQVRRVIVSKPRGNILFNVIRGSTVRELARRLPKNLDLVVVY